MYTRPQIGIALSMLLLLSPLSSAGETRYPDLRECYDADFQKIVEARLAGREGLSEAIRDGKISAILVDVSDLERPRYAGFNPELMMYAASLPKIAIALGAFVEIDRGELELDAELRGQLVRMIKNSSNRDASAVLGKVGMERLAEILSDARYGALYDPDAGGGLWVGKSYDKTTVRHGDPLKGISHAASAMQAARFYYGVMNGTLVDPKHLPLINEMFGDPSINHKFVKGLRGRDDVEIHRKSGTWQKFHADSGVITHPGDGLSYIIVAINDDAAAGQLMVGDIRVIDDLMLELHRKRGEAKR
jgi:beta-lactamase class A